MARTEEPRVAILDYGVGNLYSVARACQLADLSAEITSDPARVRSASAVILPGVGAFGSAMENLKQLKLVDPLLEAAESGKPIMGICLGIQLLMSDSVEFGHHRGLDIISGSVVRLTQTRLDGRTLKIPQVCWNQIRRASGNASSGEDPWDGTPLDGVSEGEYMYFVHSYYVQPESPSVVLSMTKYGEIEYCSSLRDGNVFACQFHPERSGRNGLRLYRGFSSIIRTWVNK